MKELTNLGIKKKNVALKLFSSEIIVCGVSLFTKEKLSSLENLYKPSIWSKLTDHGKPAFHGEIKENERIVQLKPELSASDADEAGNASKSTVFKHYLLSFIMGSF